MSERWQIAYRCVSCKGGLTHNAMMDSNGRCIRCGYKDEDAGTVVKCTEHAYRNSRPWWKFWVKQERIWKETANFYD